MIQIDAVVNLFPDLPRNELADWIARGWVQPEGMAEAGWSFAEIDVARIRLIRDLRRGMAIDEDAMPVVLSLLDQVYDMRRTLKAVLGVIEHQTPALREAVITALRR
jgi:chaperone modulatory protein CbpM